MNIEDAIDKLHLEGGLLTRKKWTDGVVIDIEDVIAEDWEVYGMPDEAEDEYEDDE
jgi:hypothetical protein